MHVKRLDRAFAELNLELTYAVWLIRALKFNYAVKLLAQRKFAVFLMINLRPKAV